MIVEHASGKYNLYLSDITGVYFALSLEDLVVTKQGIDLELVSSYTVYMSIGYDHTMNMCMYHRSMVSMEL